MMSGCCGADVMEFPRPVARLATPWTTPSDLLMFRILAVSPTMAACYVVDRNFIATDSGKLCSSLHASHSLSSALRCSDKERNRKPARPFASVPSFRGLPASNADSCSDFRTTLYISRMHSELPAISMSLWIRAPMFCCCSAC